MSEKKLFVFDLDPLIFFQQKISISLILEAIKEISNYQPVLFSGSVWNDLLFNVKKSINPTGQISLLSGDGSFLFNNYTQTYKFFEFLSVDQVDVLTHIGVTATAGLLVNSLNTNEMTFDKKKLALLSSYFLDLEQLDQVKSKWRMNFKLNYDYLTFNSEIFNAKISEIYIFSNFHSKFTKILDLSNEIDLIDRLAIKKINISENVCLFHSKKNSIYNGIISFSKDLDIKNEDIYYISLGRVDMECVEKFENIIIDNSIQTNLLSKKLGRTYSANSYDELAIILFELSNIWRDFKA